MAAGTYAPTPGTDATANFSIPAGTAIYGGFNGTETNRAQRNWQVNQTILSGAIGLGKSATNSLYVVTFSGEFSPLGADTVLDGVTVSRGQAGVLCSYASPVIRNCVIQSNLASGIYLGDSSPLIQNCSITGNTTPSEGGGLFTYALQTTNTGPLIQNCIFQNNSAGSGGAIFSQNSTPQIIGCLIYSNTATGGGGAIAAAQGTFTIINSTITANSTTFSGGGGIGVGPSQAVIKNTILWNNTSTAGASAEASQIDLRFGGSAMVSNTCVEGLVTFSNAANSPYDPIFVSAANANYRLQDCSPLVNGGNNLVLAGLTADLDGNPRIAGGTVDLGAYEDQNATSVPIFISGEPASFTYCPISPNVLSVTASGTGLGYQWKVNRNNGAGFVSLTNDAVHSGAATASLTITNPPFAMNQWRYFCQVSSAAGCSLSSTLVTLTVRPTQVYVNAAVASGGNGLSWATAFQTIHLAATSPLVNACQAQIWVAAGQYRPVAGASAKCGSALGIANLRRICGH